MTNPNSSEEKIRKLEARVKELESILNSSGYLEDLKLMEALYEKAKEVVAKYNKASVIFLQRKLLIDYDRAKRLLSRLKADGFIDLPSE